MTYFVSWSCRWGRHLGLNAHAKEGANETGEMGELYVSMWYSEGHRHFHAHIDLQCRSGVCMFASAIHVWKRGSALVNTSSDQWISSYRVKFYSPSARQFFWPRSGSQASLLVSPRVFGHLSWRFDPHWVAFIYCPKMEYITCILRFATKNSCDFFLVQQKIMFDPNAWICNPPPTWQHRMQPRRVNLQPQQEVDSWQASKLQKWNKSRKRVRTCHWLSFHVGAAKRIFGRDYRAWSCT